MQVLTLVYWVLVIPWLNRCGRSSSESKLFLLLCLKMLNYFLLHTVNVVISSAIANVDPSTATPGVRQVKLSCHIVLEELLLFLSAFTVRKFWNLSLCVVVNAVISSADVSVDPRMAVPSDLQAKSLRQIVLAGNADHVAKKVEATPGQDKKLKHAYVVSLCPQYVPW